MLISAGAAGPHPAVRWAAQGREESGADLLFPPQPFAGSTGTYATRGFSVGFFKDSRQRANRFLWTEAVARHRPTTKGYY
jgi:hypothetical protein